MKMPSFKFNMTPGRRFSVAFWTGWGFAIACNLITDLAINEKWVAVAIVSLMALTLMVIFSNNKVKFEKEFVWMTIKTGGPEKKDPAPAQNATAPRTYPHQRPPPPPAPPPKRSLGGGR